MPFQKTFTLARRAKGCHLVTDEIASAIKEGLQGVDIGVAHFFIQHTSAALSINENYDPDVRKDMDMALDHIVPESLKWKHTDEGPDDSASHTKASLIGSSVSIPISVSMDCVKTLKSTNSTDELDFLLAKGRLNLGTWQGLYLTEFRYQPHARKIVCTILP